MRKFIKLFFLPGLFWVCFLNPPVLMAQQCQDEEGIAKDYLKDLNDLVETTRKENLDDFEKSYHQKAIQAKLSLTLSMLKELGECLGKAGQDPATPKDQADANKTRQETYSKLAEKLAANQKALKSAEDPKAAKALIEKFDYSK